VLGLLIYAAVDENFLREWRVIQKSARADTGPLDLRLRQIVVPKLQTTNRCVSCHVGMSPGEMGITGSLMTQVHKAVHHDQSEFGCTVCHGGQGRATEKADAHGNVPFWPEVMIPIKYAYAGCGSCHTHVRVPNMSQMFVGQRLVERYDCLTCHRIDGRGGTIRPGAAGGIDGPDLSSIGSTGYSAQWYENHLVRHNSAADGSWKASFGPINDSERLAIDVFLSSRVGAPLLVEAKAMFQSLGCRGCHKVGGVGGDDGLDLTLAGQKDPGRLDFSHVPGKPTLENWQAEHLRHPAKVVPGSQMPEMGLSEEQVDLLTFYLFSLRRSDFPEAYWPKDRISAERFGEREFATDGETLYGTFCAACHGADGLGKRYPGMPVFPSIANPDFLSVATDEFITETIRRGRPGRRMPAWGEKQGGLRPDEIANLVGYIRRLGKVAAPGPSSVPNRWVKADTALGKQLYENRCASCHGQRGEGIEAPALNNKVLLASASDTYLVETIGRGRNGTSMNGFRNPSTIHPTLSDAEIQAIVTFIRTWEESSP